MNLLIDIGNTRIKWALCAPDAPPGQWIDSGHLGHGETATLAGILAGHPAIERVLGTNVAGPAVAAALGTALATHGLQPHWLLPSERCAGVENGYDTPTQLGADRWAALIGAHHLHPGPCLVVSAGTATTADLLDADGRFRGGVILPGVDLMLKALAGNTAQLPLADGHFRATPRNTADAIVSGCLLAQAGAIERMFRAIADQPGAHCLLAGGAAHRFAGLLEMPLRQVAQLVLIGLARVAQDAPERGPMG